MSHHLHIRSTEAALDRYRAEADRRGCSLTELVHAALEREITAPEAGSVAELRRQVAELRARLDQIRALTE